MGVSAWRRPAAWFAIALLGACSARVGLPEGGPPEDLTTCVGAACPCRVNGDCVGSTKICDPSSHRCVQCLSVADCSNGTTCVAGSCVPSCNGTMCGACQVCERDAGVCVACLTDNDCVGCGGRRCDPALH